MKENNTTGIIVLVIFFLIIVAGVMYMGEKNKKVVVKEKPSYQPPKTIKAVITPKLSLKFISKDEYGKKWPFTVKRGLLKCKHNSVTFTTGGIEYAVNGMATTDGYPDIKPIWLIDKKTKKMIKDHTLKNGEKWDESKSSNNPRISIGDITLDGLNLCE